MKPEFRWGCGRGTLMPGQRPMPGILIPVKFPGPPSSCARLRYRVRYAWWFLSHAWRVLPAGHPQRHETILAWLADEPEGL